MEKQVNELISKIMNSANLNPNDLNKIIELHEMVDKKQVKRLEMALRDKLKEINVDLSEEYLDTLENMLFYRDGKADIVDLRIINKNEVAIIRDEEIELGDFSYDVSELRAGLSLQEEAYLCEASRIGKEPEYCDPEEIFSEFYSQMNDKIRDLRVDLNILDRNVKMYFDRELDSFYFDNPKSFKVIITELPNVIEIYEIDATQDKWIPTQINGDYIYDLMKQNDFSLLSVNFIIEDAKRNLQYRDIRNNLSKIDIENALDKFKKEPFSIENLVKTYNNLFKNNNCMLEENESEIIRLKYITAEKLVLQGFEYEKAFAYTEVIFETIQSYKKQIMSAINGENSFPNESLVETVKKINCENDITFQDIDPKILISKFETSNRDTKTFHGAIKPKEMIGIIEGQGPTLKKTRKNMYGGCHE